MRHNYAVVLAFLCFAFFVPSASANTFVRVATAVPRAMGRTAVNMVTFRDKEAAVQEWLIVAAVMADARTTQQVEQRCAACSEESFVLGHRPSAGRLYVSMGTQALLESSFVQWSHEYLSPNEDLKPQPQPMARLVRKTSVVSNHLTFWENFATWVLPVAADSEHGYAAWHNSQIRGDKP